MNYHFRVSPLNILSVPVCLPRRELVGLPEQMIERVEDDYREIEGRFKKFQLIVETA